MFAHAAAFHLAVPYVVHSLEWTAMDTPISLHLYLIERARYVCERDAAANVPCHTL
jgi:hypothetical protein